MGSIPVAGANERSALRQTFCVFDTLRLRSGFAVLVPMVRNFGAERVKLACKRQAKRYSHICEIPVLTSFFVNKERQNHLVLPFCFLLQNENQEEYREE